MPFNMEVIRDREGFKRPDMDFRWVPSCIMAEYLDVHENTIYRRTLKGIYKVGVRKHGRNYEYQPAALIKAQNAVGAA